MSHRSHPPRFVPALSLLVGVAASCTTAGTTGGGALTTTSAAQQSTRVSATVRSDAHILGVLHTSNLGEIAAGMQAQQRATDTAVKAFAMSMVTEHSTMDQQGSALGQQIGAPPALPDSTLPRLQQTEMDALRAAGSGAAFDQLYIAQQVVAHQRTLSLVDASIGTAQRPELKTALQSQVRPAVAGHLAQAQQIQSRIGQPSGSISSNPSTNRSPGASSGGSTGASSTGGMSTGGSSTGGSSTGGSSTGGSSTGGSSTGGSSTGGSPTGGSPTGGSPTGGTPTGGSPTGGGSTTPPPNNP